MPRILVVDYSRTGNTHKVGAAIAKACDADLEEIRDSRPRRGLWGWIRSAREAMRAMPAEIRPTKRDPASYDLVVVGSPVWTGHVSSPMRSYLTQRRGSFARLALFVTEGGSGGPRALAEMASLAGRQAAATMELRARELGDDLPSSIGSFVEQVRRAASKAGTAAQS